MKIKLRTLCAGPCGVYQPGIHNLPDPLATQLIASGAAQAVEDVVQTKQLDSQTQTLEPQETAAYKKPKRKR